MKSSKPLFIVDDNIPFIEGRLEPVAEVRYVDQFGFTPEIVKDADALLIRTRTRCNEELLGKSGARLVATATIGMDQIDIPWCESHGITVRNSPGCNAPGVAQYVWSSLLRLGMKPGEHTIGVVGHGNVGSIVAEWGRAMGFDILLCDPPKAELTGRADDYLSLEKVLKRSDAVSLHTPLTKTGKHPTLHLINSDNLGLIRPGSILVNAARGPVVETEALLKGIEGGLRGVVDTWEGEPDLDRRLLDAAEIGTFHIAGYSREGKERATRMVIEAVEDTFGLTVDKSGLAAARDDSGKIIDPEVIAGSYDPYVDDRALRADPGAFDRLRRDYDFRPEPVFSDR